MSLRRESEVDDEDEDDDEEVEALEIVRFLGVSVEGSTLMERRSIVLVWIEEGRFNCFEEIGV